jgi:hypothetical protein
MFWVLLASAAFLTVSILAWKQALQRTSRRGIYWISPTGPSYERGGLDLEIGERIFSAADWEIVRSETKGSFARGFRDERTVLALEWLRLLRSQVRSLVDEYRLLARMDGNVRVVDELQMAVQFFLFELTTGLLCWLILIHGPSRVARVFAWSLDSGQELRRMVRQVAPKPSAAASGIVKTS